MALLCGRVRCAFDELYTELLHVVRSFSDSLGSNRSGSLGVHLSIISQIVCCFHVVVSGNLVTNRDPLLVEAVTQAQC